MKAFILAAGSGTRLKPLTDNQPKVMIKIGGKPILEHLILLCRNHNIKDIIINLHFLPQMITDYFQDGQKFGVHLNYSRETDKIMGGAGALKQAGKWLKNDSFFVLNGDVMTNIDLTAMTKFHQKNNGIGTVLVHSTDHPFDSDLVENDQSGLITRFYRSQAGEQSKAIAKTGTHVFSPKIFKFIPAKTVYSLESQLLPDLLAKKQQLYAYYSNCYSKDMGTLSRLQQVQQDYAAKKITF